MDVNKLVEKIRGVSSSSSLLQKSRAKMASTRYGNPAKSLKVVVVVGTNGKTTTTQYLKEMLGEAGQTAEVLTARSSLGVEKVQRFLKEAKNREAMYAIVALGSRDIRAHVLDAAAVEGVVVTNVSDTPEETAESAASAIEQLLGSEPRFIVLNRDDPSFETFSGYPAEQSISYGVSDDAEAKIASMKLYKKGSEAHMVVDNRTGIDLATYLVGTANIYNMVAAATMVYVAGENIQRLDEGAARLEEIPSSFQYVEVETPYSIAYDCAPNEAAMVRVIDSARQIAKRRLIVALDAVIVGEDAIKQIAKQADRLIVVGMSTKEQGHAEAVDSPETAIKHALRAARTGDSVLIAGEIFAPTGMHDLTATITNILQD